MRWPVIQDVRVESGLRLCNDAKSARPEFTSRITDGRQHTDSKSRWGVLRSQAERHSKRPPEKQKTHQKVKRQQKDQKTVCHFTDVDGITPGSNPCRFVDHPDLTACQRNGIGTERPVAEIAVDGEQKLVVSAGYNAMCVTGEQR